MNVESQPDTFTYKVYGKNAKTDHYYDDGKTMKYKNGEFNLASISISDEKVDIDYLNKGLEEKKKEFIFIN